MTVHNSPIQRFLQKITINSNGCWVWTGRLDYYGYGTMKVINKTKKSHRFIYEYYHGMICPDLTIDHLCRNKACSNPIHLEQVTNRENILRGNNPAAINARRTHCIHGHKYCTQNAYTPFKGQRRCKWCTLKNNKLSRLRKKEILSYS